MKRLSQTKLILVCGLLAMLSTGALGIEPPIVLLTGKYAEPHADLLAELGARVRWVTLEQLTEGVGLDEATMVLIAHTERPLPPLLEKRLAGFVRNGGTLYLELTPFPTGELAPPSPHRFVSGWAPDIELVRPDDPLFTHVPKGRTLWRYGAWGSGIFVDDAFVLARWTFPPQRTSEAFRERPAAIARWEIGKGQVVFVGAALAFIGSTNPLARALHIALIGEERLPILQLTKLLETPVKVTESAQGLTTRTVGIFREPNFPRIGLPEDVTPEFVASVLKKHGIPVVFLSASDLASPEKLNARNINTLVLTYGPAVPLDALSNIKRFLAEGGGMVSLAGIPLSRPQVLVGNRWRDAFAELETGTVMTLFRHLLPFAKAYRARKPPKFCIVLNRQLLPNLPPMWEFSGGEWAVIPIVDGSQHLAEPLLASVSADGDVVALPVVFAYRLSRYPCARIVALGFWGNHHPWSRKAWRYAEQAIVDIVQLALRRHYIAIRDLMSNQPCYLPKETVKLTAELVCPVEVSARCHLLIRERDMGQVVYVTKRSLKLQDGKPQTVTFEWQLPDDPHWAYDAILTVETPDGLRFHERTMFLVRSDRTIAMVRQARKVRWLPYQGMPLLGINLYTNNPRGIGAYFDSEQRLGKHPLPDLWDREISLTRLYGGNTIRQHYYERILNEQVFADESYNWAKRVMDANHILLALHNVIALVNPFTFSPAYYWGKRLGQGDPYSDEQWLQAEEAYLQGLAKWLADFPNVAWEIINEPEGYGRNARTEEERRQFAERIAAWCRRMVQAIETGRGAMDRGRESRWIGRVEIGIGLAWAPSSPVWSVRHHLRFLSWSHAHHYQTTLGEGVWFLPFALNFGRPCIVGEAGMPNATNSPYPFLREWGEIYDQMLAVVFAERAFGFTNFYLNNPLQSPEAPEWGIMRHDGTEREACRIFTRWSILFRLLSQDYRPPFVGILLDSDSVMQQPAVIGEVASIYRRLLESGTHAIVLSEHDVTGWLHELREKRMTHAWLIIPEQANPSAETWKLLQKVREGAENFRPQVTLWFVPLTRNYPQWLKPFHSLSDLMGVAKEHFTTPLSRIVYKLMKPDEGFTLVLVDGTGIEGEVRVYSNRLQLKVPKGRCAVLDFSKEGDLRLISGYGSVTLNGRMVVKAPEDVAWIVWAKFPEAITKGVAGLTPYVSVWSDNQRAVELTLPVENALERLGQVTVYTAPQFADLAQKVVQGLKERGLKVRLVKGAKPPWKPNAIVIDQVPQNSALAQMLRDRKGIHAVGTEGWAFWRKGMMRIWQPWSGLIVTVTETRKVERKSDEDEVEEREEHLIVLTGVTEAAVRMAALKFLTLRSFGDYCAAPFCPLD